jgi:predicted negative regulator of RcsB-dependent stress response
MQTLLVIVCILAAATYLGWQFYQRFFKADGKCDGCAIGKTQEK